VNYGDVNPVDHGGMWVRWNDGLWELRETVPPGVLPRDMTTHEHLVESGYVEPCEVWVGGDPDEGPTELTERFIDESGRYDSVETLYVDGSVDWLIPNWMWYRGGSRSNLVPESELADYLGCDGIQL
jgi:hypothetical protein